MCCVVRQSDTCAAPSCFPDPGRNTLRHQAGGDTDVLDVLVRKVVSGHLISRVIHPG